MALIINGETIDDEVVSQEFSNVKAYFQQRGDISCCERDAEFRKTATDNLITRILLVQEARRTTEPVAPAEVDQALENLKKEHGGAEKFYAAFNLVPDQEGIVKRDLESSLLVQKMLERLAAADPEPAEADLEDYYRKNIERYKTAEEVRASHILKRLSRGVDRTKVFEELREVRGRLLAGADFDAAAREHSDNCKEEPGEAEKPQGDPIDLGFFRRGTFVEEFELVAFSLGDGEVSPVFLTPFGYHLVKRTGRKPATPKPFEEIRAAVRDHFLEERRRLKVEAYAGELRARACIEGLEEESPQTHGH
jgi:parvulin-like peptidyl-prolyl isomerase